MIRVMLVDDHRIVLAGLAGLIEAAEDMEVVALAGDGDVAAQLALQTRPDVILMDLSMPQVDGLEATRRVLELCPDCYVLVLTSFSDRARIVDALRAGAVGYLLKDSEPDDVLRGIRAAARGESPLDPRVAREVLRTGATAVTRPALTDREHAVLRLVARGLGNKQIGARLGIRESTVKTHLSSAFQRIGVTDRTSAAMWVQSNLPDDDD